MKPNFVKKYVVVFLKEQSVLLSAELKTDYECGRDINYVGTSDDFFLMGSPMSYYDSTNSRQVLFNTEEEAMNSVEFYPEYYLGFTITPIYVNENKQ